MDKRLFLAGVSRWSNVKRNLVGTSTVRTEIIIDSEAFEYGLCYCNFLIEVEQVPEVQV